MRVEIHHPKFRSFFFLLLATVSTFAFGHLARAQAPTISGITPSGALQFQPTNLLSFTAGSARGVEAPGGSGQLTGTTWSGQSSVITLTTANGLVLGGMVTSRTITAPLSSNMVYTAVINVTNVI